ncbi:MAG TPA: tetratricopeptide repeat protein [Pyrinomonadaceae bacterium]|nr:tetratricopeptide repeat protein [Pyrinomonadaceae bacterium]
MNLRSIYRVWFFFSFFILTVPAAHAQREDMMQRRGTAGGSVAITGRVLLPSGGVADNGVRVTLRDSTLPLATTPADRNGEFKFANLAEGIYFVEVVGDGKLYEPVTQQVELVRGRGANLTIYLKPKSEVRDAKARDRSVSLAELNQKVPAGARKEYEKSLKLAEDGKTEQAVERLRQAIALYPDYLTARAQLGAQYLKLKMPAEAVEQFEAALRIDPKAFRPRLNIGIVAVEQKDYPTAINHLRQALTADASDPAPHLYLGIALLGTDDLQSSFDELSKAIILGNSDYAVAHYYIAFIHAKRGERADAVRELKAYLESSPTGELADHARVMLDRMN